MGNNSLKSKFVNATKWAALTEILAKIVSPITNMILARMITPEAFGVVATITMIISFTDMFTDAGFQKYLVQHEFSSKEEKYQNANVAFWTNFMISILLWGLIITFREPISNMVGNPGLGNVIAIACVQLLLTSFSSIQMALYRREFDFKTLFMVRVVAICVPFTVTIPLAYFGFSYWALIIGSISIQFTNAIILTIKSKWKPTFFYKLSILKEMLSFSIWSLLEAISIWLTAWADVFIVGSVLDSYYLGVYKTSINTVNSIMSIIAASTTPIIFSALSRLQDDDNKFKRMFFDSQRIAAIILIPLGVGIYIFRDFVTDILLGSQWKMASDIVGIWGLTSAIKMILGDYCSEVFRAKGKPKLSLLAQVLHLVVLIPTCIVSVKYDFYILVNVRAWIRIQLIIVQWLFMYFVIKIPIQKTFKNIYPYLIATFFMGLIAIGLKIVYKGVIWSCISILICIIFYFYFIYTIDPFVKKRMIKEFKLRKKYKGRV